MDEMNRNAGPDTTDQKQDEKGTEGQEDIKIWKKPQSGRKKKYVYEVITEEPDTADHTAAGDGYYHETVSEPESAEPEPDGGFDSERSGGSGSRTETEPDTGNAETQSKTKTQSKLKTRSKRETQPENRESGIRKKRRLFAGGRSGKRKKSGEKETSVKPDSGSKKKENLLEKDNISKKARQEFWKQQVIEGNPNRPGFMKRFVQGFQKYGKRVIAIVLVVALVFGVSWYYNRNRKFHSYDVEWQVSASDTGYSEYLSFNGVILHYSQDGVSCINQNGEVMWNQAFNMDVPGIAVSGSFAVIYDIKGTSLYICDVNGCTGSAQTQKKILKADISDSGVVAVVLDDKTSNYINYFRKDGSQIDLEIKTLISGDGYPLDIAISPDGKQLITSYVYADSGNMMNQVVFRNFEVGKNNADRVVGGFRQYKETLVPEVIFFDDQNSAAVTEKSIDFYSTRNAMSPELAKTQEFDSRIRTVFYSDAYIGVVLDRGENQEEAGTEEETQKVEATADEGSSEETTKQAVETAYTMLVFDKTGSRTFEQTIDFEYGYAEFSGDGIVVYNNSECAVYNMTGVCKYQAKLDVNIDGVMRFSENSLVIQGNGALQKLTLK